MTTDPIFPVLLALRYMHILGAIALMGGTIFMRFALRPVVVQLPPETKAAIHDQVRTRWSKFVMLASALLLISGITNLILAGRFDFDPVLGKEKGYHMVVGAKFLLALPIFLIAALLSGRTGAAKRMQQNVEFWMNLNLTLALLMVLIGGYLRFISRKPTADRPVQAALWRAGDVSSPVVSQPTLANASPLAVSQNASEKLPFSAARN